MTASDQPDHLNAFIRTAQYLAGLTIVQDVWTESCRMLVSFWGADFAGIGECMEDGDIVGHHWTFADETAGSIQLTAEMKEATAEVLKDGFLTSCVLPSSPEPHSVAFMPISKESRVVAVLLVGHKTSEPLSKELLSTYLGVAGLVGLTSARLASEADVREHRLRLEEMVNVRTEQLTKSNEQLKEQVSQRSQASEFLYNVLESLTHPFYVINPHDYTIELANSTAVADGIIRGLTCYALGHGRRDPCSGPEHPCPLEEVKRTKQPVIMEHIHRTADGTQRNVEIHAYPILDSEGNIDRVIEYTLDITDRKKVEEQLRKSEERFRSAFQYSGTGMALVDEDGGFVSVNPAVCKILGYSEQEMLRRNFVDITHPEDLEKSVANYKKLLAGEFDHYEAEKRYIHKEGQTIWGRLNVALVRDKSGAPIYAIAQLNDITTRRRAEKALQQRNALFRVIFEQAAVGVAQIHSKTGRFVEINQRYCDIVGYTREEMEELTFPEITHPDDSQTDRETLELLITGQVTKITLEKRYLHKNGSIVWVNLTVSPMWEAGEEPSFHIAVAEDITDRKMAEQALVEEKERLSVTLASIGDGVIVVDPESRIVSLNDAAVELTGWDEHEAVGRPLPEVFCIMNAHTREVVASPVKKVIDTGGIVGLANDTILVARDGTERVIWDSGAPMRDSEGTIFGVILVFTDVTEHYAARRALEESEQQFRLLLHSSNDHIFMIDPSGTYLFSNADSEYLELNYGKKEIIGLTVREIFSGASGEAYWEYLSHVVQTGEPVEFDHEIGLNGRVRFHQDTLYPIMRGGRVWAVGGISRDVTDLHALEERLREARKMESIGILAGGISHDFNNLLQVILGFSESLLSEKNNDSPDYDQLMAIYRSAQRGADLVKQILTFSRRVDISFRPVDLNTVVEMTERLLFRTIPKMIEIELDLEEELRVILADETQIEEILLNLALNAKDAMPDGGKLVFQTRNVDLTEADCEGIPDLAPGEYVRLAVSDNGRGMEQDIVEHVFEPFFTTKEPGDGTGLGLSSVFGIVKMHRGQVSCDSTPGEGTRFEILLPIRSARMEAVESIDEPLPKGGRETILVVDDEPLITELAKRVLRSGGYTVLVATNGQEALSIFQDRHREIDLVILDLIMPEMGGRECLENMLKIDAQVKVLIASGFAIEGTAKRFLDSEARGSVRKPFRAKELLGAVRKAIERP